MKRTIFLATAVVGCLASTRVSIQLIPLVVVITLAAFMVIIGLFGARRQADDDDLAITQRLPRLDQRNVDAGTGPFAV